MRSYSRYGSQLLCLGPMCTRHLHPLSPLIGPVSLVTLA